MTKNFVTYDDIQEALRLTAEAAEKQDNVVTIPTSAGPHQMDFKPLALAVVENFATSLKTVCIQTAKPFKGQAWVDMAITHAERANELLNVARLTNDTTQRAAALRDAHEHLDESRKMTLQAAIRVNEELQKRPGEAVKLSDDFDVKTKVPTL